MKRRAYLATAGATIAIVGCLDHNPGAHRDRGDDTGGGSSRTDSSGDGAWTDDGGGSDDGKGDGSSDEYPDLAGTVEDFEDIDDVAAVGNLTVRAGSVSVDRSHAAIGTQSVRLEPTSEDGWVRLSLSFDEPVDVTEVVPGVAVRSESMAIPRLRIYDDGEDSKEFRRVVQGGLPFMRYNFGHAETYGSPDHRRIQAVQLALPETDRTDRLWIDDIHLTPRPSTGAVMVQFDDGYETDYTEAYARLREHDYPAVTFVNPGRIGRDEFLDLDQASALHDAGWTVANHCYTHPNLTELSRAEQETQIVDGRDWLRDHGFEDGARYFAYPFGRYDATTLELVDAHHELGFAGGFPVQGYATNPLLCSRVGDPSAKTAVEMLDRTATHRGLTALMYHRLDEDLLADFEGMVEHLHTLASRGDLQVITPMDLEQDYVLEA